MVYLRLFTGFRNPQLVGLIARMDKFSYKMDRPTEKGELKYVLMEPGALSVIMDGVTMMHVWPADN